MNTTITRKQLANALRFLSIDAIQKAKSGHPGMPMGMADIAEVLWNDFLQHNPLEPNWPNRDRFILSNGHGSMLLYALLHLSGYDLSLAELQQFRQLNSKTPGHPEYSLTTGIEMTTGPLGQGIASAVGIALAEQLMANRFNISTFQIINHYTYCFVGDGCLMEGISHEVCSLAGSLGLGKLITFWDNNGITLDGPIANCCSENTVQRFLAYGWQVIANIDGHDPAMINQAIITAKQNTKQPTLICCNTTIGYGSPNFAGNAKAHGVPLGPEEIALIRQNLNWHYPEFVIPPEIYTAWDAKAKGTNLVTAWNTTFQHYQQQHPKLAQEFLRYLRGQLPTSWHQQWQQFIANLQEQLPHIATREASLQSLNFLSQYLPELIGGSADVTSSTFSKANNAIAITAQNFNGNYINYGIRELGMAGIMNGLALSNGLIPYGSTFLVFSDYARAAIRLAALMRLRVIYVFTHDSIAIGEDGPTHQPIEQLAALRIIPNLSLWRPADAVETGIAWQQAIEHTSGPTVLALTRQAVPCQLRTYQQLKQIKQGGYVLLDSPEQAQLILLATGSELALAMAAAKMVIAKGYNIRVVSMPAANVFLKQSLEYQQAILPASIPKLVIEAGITNYWHQFTQGHGNIIGLNSYGKSAPAEQLYNYFHFTVEDIVNAMYDILQQ